MKKLKLQVQISVDGFIAGPHGEMDWLVWDWDADLKNYVGSLTASIDTILLGRKLAEGFIPHWTTVASDPANPEVDFGKMMIDTPKVVFTRTLQESPWTNTTLATGDLTAEVTRLKQQGGQDMIVYGGAGFVSSLIQAGLIDEYHLFVNPAVLGKGLPIFRDVNQQTSLTLVNAANFPCGIALLHYEPR